MSDLGQLPASVPEECDAEIRRMVRYWQSLHRDGELPERRDIDPVAFYDLLAGTALIDIARSPFRFRFRLLGERMQSYHGRNFTGRWLDEVFPHFNETTTPGDLTSVVEIGQPNYRIGVPLMTYEKAFFEMERIFLPFRNGGDTVDIIMAYTIFR